MLRELDALNELTIDSKCAILDVEERDFSDPLPGQRRLRPWVVRAEFDPSATGRRAELDRPHSSLLFAGSPSQAIPSSSESSRATSPKKGEKMLGGFP